MKKQSFLTGAIILTISGIVCKILGAIYKIPLTNILGSQGMGFYYIIFPVYAFLLSFVSSCFTISISKKVSSAMAEGNFSMAHGYLRASLLLLTFLGVGLCMVLIVLARLIAYLQGIASIYICYLIIAPSIIAVAIQGAFKGFFQGLQNMTPSAISQVVEEILKLTVGFSLASLLVEKSELFGACGALVGILVAEVGTCVYFTVSYFAFKINNKSLFVHSKKCNLQEKPHSLEKNDNSIACKNKNSLCQSKLDKIGAKRKIINFFCSQNTSKNCQCKENSCKKPLCKLMGEVFANAVPFMLSSLVIPLSLVVDSFLIVNILKNMGFDKFFATALLGLNAGVVSTLVGLPATLSSSLCTTIVPFITYSIARGDVSATSQKICLALKLTVIVSLPCFFVFMFFSPKVINVLYSFDSVYEFNMASTLLMISSINALYLSILQLTIAILQAFGKTYIPVVNLSIGLLFKVLFEFILINIPDINISGAIVSNIACYFVPSVLNIIQIKKLVSLSPSLWRTFVSPAIASVIMVAIIALCLTFTTNYLSPKLATLISFFVGAVSYFVCILLFKTFLKEEKQDFWLFRTKKKSPS
ncbi:MAG: polysaccharide biosynthesis C-terminal domain-containing protein [Christensenellales bacterium]